MTQITIGIDISKDQLDAHRLFRVGQIGNESGILQFALGLDHHINGRRRSRMLHGDAGLARGQFGAIGIEGGRLRLTAVVQVRDDDGRLPEKDVERRVDNDQTFTVVGFCTTVRIECKANLYRHTHRTREWRYGYLVLEFNTRKFTNTVVAHVDVDGQRLIEAQVGPIDRRARRSRLDPER